MSRVNYYGDNNLLYQKEFDGSNSRSDCRLEEAEPEIRFDDCSRGQRRVIGASGCSALLPWLKGTLGCEGAPRVAIGEEALAVGREVGGGVGCAPESSEPQTVVAMLYSIVKQRSQLEKTISGYDFVERGWRLGISDSRVETTRLDNIAIVVMHFTEYQPFSDEEEGVITCSGMRWRLTVV
ncbi:hypothetical protein BHE74_00002930 [Ensete ventricosum]|nr:hypothetical protein BHE74_00002930 [Ensete ventricosum]RZR77333.1 hypothetical protein BHM03_00002374 [Ensete ventricosum]